jgi:polysaccharide export outer membrane protein
MTFGQAADEITGKLKRFIKNPQVTVELVAPAKMQVTVSGEVRSPGVYPVGADARLMDAITAAGGYTPNANLSQVTISHAGDSGAATIVDLSKFLLSGDASVNVTVAPGDTVLVPTKETAAVGTVMILGAVRQSGQHPITQGMTLREAIMLAGGPTELADLGNVTLRHEGSTEETKLDYASAAAGDPSADPELKPGDVIFIASQEQLGTYTILGAVANPGKYDLKGETSITEAIAVAGGVRERAKLGDVRVVREADGQTETVKVNVSEIMVGKTANVTLRDKDSIYIASGKGKTDYLRIASLVLSLAWLVMRK